MSFRTSLDSALNIADLRVLAKRRMPKVIFDYLERGSEDEHTFHRNRAAFERYALVPKIVSGHKKRDLSVTLFGDKLASPWIVGPTGLNGIFWRGADIALARATARAGGVFTLGTAASTSIEDLAAASDGVKWFQLYPWADRKVWGRLMQRAQDAGYRAMIVTVDTVVPGNREQDRRNHFAHNVSYTPKVILDGLLHPRWLAGVWLNGPRPRTENVVEFVGPEATATELADFSRRARNPDLSWDDLEWMRAQWDGPFLIKGVLHPDDAIRAANMGFDGVVVSNHGGRQLDQAISTLEALPPILDAVGKRMTVIVDGGFRRGTDAVKALALGAKAVLLGRAPLYGVSAAGEAGADRALTILNEETERVLALLGCGSVRALTRDFVREVPPIP